MKIDRRSTADRRTREGKYSLPERRFFNRRRTLQQAFIWHHTHMNSLR